MQQMRKIKAERAYLKSSTKKSSEAETWIKAYLTSHALGMQEALKKC